MTNAGARNGSSAPIQVFRPKWQIQFDNGTLFPASFHGIHLGTVAERKATRGKEKVQQLTNTPFDPEWDIIFIDNYVFTYCERPDATITFDVENGLPENLASVQNVAIDASSLLMKRHDVWYKKLRFILRNFPKVQRITIVATVILDIASPEYMSGPNMYHMDIQNISVEDRIRHGILFGEEFNSFPHCTKTLRPSDFAIRAWNDLPNHWPSWRKRMEDNTTPCLFMTAMVYLKKEWVSLDGEGGRGGPCNLGSQGVDISGMLIRNEIKRQSTEKENKKRSAGSKPEVKKQASAFSLGKKKSMFSLKNRPSMPMLSSQATSLAGQL
ncbi:hypothetical protein VMCG_05155 [Cytospora schulzeri]|uniref:Uncharacterized protein n=1 Tax=Cytospora schulzeri TaxID=448051 RepID=A0A423WR62_9PEZI|nr:hypothetical protein VMCG_05155 [Valsa malicola]